MYMDGAGVAQDYNQAVFWFNKAAEQGDADGQYQLGFMYYYGKGVTQDYNQAVILFRKAAQQGNANAIAALKN
ncbi:MAG: tetratricopeptide repeat protein, partial [Methylococcales bacterium]